MRFPVIISIFLHAAIFLAFSHGISFDDDIDVPPPINVDIVDISEISQTNKVAPPLPKVSKKEPKKEKEITKKPPKKAIAKPSVPSEPEVDEIAVPLPDEKTKVVKTKTKPKQKPKPPVKKPKLKDKPPVKEIETDDSFQSVLKNLVDQKIEEKSDATEEGENAPDTTQIATLSDRMTISEMDALRRQLEGCWNVPIGAKNADDLIVDVRLVVNQDKTVKDARVVDRARYGSDPFFRAAADSAIRAVLSDDCNPLILPDGKYAQWKTIKFRFNPKEMF